MKSPATFSKTNFLLSLALFALFVTVFLHTWQNFAKLSSLPFSLSQVEAKNLGKIFTFNNPAVKNFQAFLQEHNLQNDKILLADPDKANLDKAVQQNTNKVNKQTILDLQIFSGKSDSQQKHHRVFLSEVNSPHLYSVFIASVLKLLGLLHLAPAFDDFNLLIYSTRLLSLAGLIFFLWAFYLVLRKEQVNAFLCSTVVLVLCATLTLNTVFIEARGDSIALGCGMLAFYYFIPRVRTYQALSVLGYTSLALLPFLFTLNLLYLVFLVSVLLILNSVKNRASLLLSTTFAFVVLGLNLLFTLLYSTHDLWLTLHQAFANFGAGIGSFFHNPFMALLQIVINLLVYFVLNWQLIVVWALLLFSGALAAHRNIATIHPSYTLLLAGLLAGLLTSTNPSATGTVFNNLSNNTVAFTICFLGLLWYFALVLDQAFKASIHSTNNPANNPDRVSIKHILQNKQIVRLSKQLLIIMAIALMFSVSWAKPPVLNTIAKDPQIVLNTNRFLNEVAEQGVNVLFQDSVLFWKFHDMPNSNKNASNSSKQLNNFVGEDCSNSLTELINNSADKLNNKSKYNAYYLYSAEPASDDLKVNGQFYEYLILAKSSQLNKQFTTSTQNDKLSKEQNSTFKGLNNSLYFPIQKALIFGEEAIVYKKVLEDPLYSEEQESKIENDTFATFRRIE